jgi:hypothetical protein
MPRYHMHLTDGVDLMLDRLGAEIADEEQLERAAFGSALALMRSVPRHREWSGWIVAVHDEDGFQVDTLSFPNARVFTDLLWQSGCERLPEAVPSYAGGGAAVLNRSG